jgi:hypothetical protein
LFAALVVSNQLLVFFEDSTCLVEGGLAILQILFFSNLHVGIIVHKQIQKIPVAYIRRLDFEGDPQPYISAGKYLSLFESPANHI